MRVLFGVLVICLVAITLPVLACKTQDCLERRRALRAWMSCLKLAASEAKSDYPLWEAPPREILARADALYRKRPLPRHLLGEDAWQTISRVKAA